ncbi:MAG: hypothetical protein IT519_16680 [Burkholderiales bacterium]|nr:hypothetical protein [Burkholderiales bacterium]
MVARLRAAPLLVKSPSERVRIAHRTPVPRDECPAIRVVPIRNRRTSGKDCDARALAVRVQLFTRDDDGTAGESADDLLAAVLARLKPARGDAIPYPQGVALDVAEEVTLDDEIADIDVAFAEITVTASYTVPTGQV